MNRTVCRLWPVLITTAFLLSPAAVNADIPAGERWLASSRLAVGLHSDGSLINTAANIGILWDPDGTAGPLPLGGDIIRVGRLFETWSLGYVTGERGVTVVNAGPWMDEGLRFDWQAPVMTPGVSSIRGVTENEDLRVALRVDVALTQDLIYFSFEITAKSDLEGLWVSKSIDLDFDEYTTGSLRTLNSAGGSVAVSEGAFDGRALAMTTRDGRGAVCRWCTTRDEILGGTMMSEADDQIGVVREVGALRAMDVAQVQFVYALALSGTSATASVEAARDNPDIDGDGLSEVDGDCDDRHAQSHPGAPERADMRDNDCDGEIDEDARLLDDDGDGFSAAEGDCDDTEARAYPRAPPVNGVLDADCDGLLDDGSWPPMGGEREVETQVVVESGCSAIAPKSGHGALFCLGIAVLGIIRRRSGR